MENALRMSNVENNISFAVVISRKLSKLFMHNFYIQRISCKWDSRLLFSKYWAVIIITILIIKNR